VGIGIPQLCFWRSPYYLHGLFLLNSLLVFWYFSNSIVGNKSPATSLFLLLSLLFLVPACRNLPAVWSTQKGWILGLLVFGCFHILHLAAFGVEIGDDYDKPAKAIAAVLILLYLLKYGCSENVVGTAVAVSAIAAGGYAIYEVFVLNLPRAGTLTNPIRYGYLTVTIALLCFFYLSISQHRWQQVIYAVSGSIGLVGAYCTGTRGIALILIGVGIFLFYRIAKKAHFSPPKLLLGTFGLSVIVIALALSTDVFQSAVKRTVTEVEKTTAGNWNNSLGYRLQMWHVAGYLGIQAPLTGVGTDYEVIGEKTAGFIEEHKYNPVVVTYFRHFHNQYLDTFAKQGVPGLLVWLLLLSLAMSGMKTYYRYAVLMILMTLVLGGLTEAVLRSSRLFYLMVIGISVFRCLDYQLALVQKNNLALK